MEKLSLVDPAIISACSAWTCPPTHPKRILAFSSLVTHRVVIIVIATCKMLRRKGFPLNYP